MLNLSHPAPFSFCVLTKHGGKVSVEYVSSGCVARACSEVTLTHSAGVPQLPYSPSQLTQCFNGLLR